MFLPQHLQLVVTPSEEPPSAQDSHLMSLAREHGSISRLFDGTFGGFPEGGCRVADE